MNGPTKDDWEEVRRDVREKHGLSAFWSSFHPATSQDPPHLAIDFLIVDPAQRGAGRGTGASKQVLAWADEHGVVVTLTPQAEPGYKKKLVDWYRGMGFVPNKGRKADHRYRDSMIRYPKLRASNPADVDACVLGKWAWDRDQSVCGADAPDPSTAARRLAKKRWTPHEKRIQARLLRGES